MCRQRLAKDREDIPCTVSIVYTIKVLYRFYFCTANFPRSVLEISAEEIKEWFSPKDFMIGVTINLMGRRFFMYV